MGDHNAAGRGAPKGQNRANVLQLKLIGQSHPTGLTANLLKLFEPRLPLEFKPPPEKRKCLPYTGMAQFVSQFAEPEDPEYALPIQKSETPAQRRERIHKLRLEKGTEKATEELQKYDPNSDPNISGDPYKTLFVARINYETTESRIKREFESYGPIKRVRMVTDKATNKPRGYAFIEYLHTRDMKAAYKQADGRKLDGRRVLVDVERGRTVPNWRPRRLGGGLGTARAGGEEANHREAPQSGVPSRSEEPRAREDHHNEREKSREREREKERSMERSHDMVKDHNHREDRHHRDRDRDRERDHARDKDRERDRARDRNRDKDHSREMVRDHDQRERERDRRRDRDRDRDRGRGRDYDHDRPRKRERDHDYKIRDHSEPKHERDCLGGGYQDDIDYDRVEEVGDLRWHEQPELSSRQPDEVPDGHYEHCRGRGPLDELDSYDGCLRHECAHPHHDRADSREREHEEMTLIGS